MSLKLPAVIAVILVAAAFSPSRAADAPQAERSPVLIELFTSEGCSSCPPADRYLQKLDEQPVAGAQLIVLSEHVDYWNHDGWKDPYSSPVLTERQRVYSLRFHLDTVYTPQMVVDGAREFSGADAAKAQAAIAESLPRPKLAIHISAISVDGPRVQAKVETASLDSTYGIKSADLYVVVAQIHAESQVLRGENANRRLTHTSVARAISRVGKIKVGEKFSQPVGLKIDSPVDPHNLRVVAFLQDPSSGRIIGSAMRTVDGLAP